jgi:hypothetical protein
MAFGISAIMDLNLSYLIDAHIEVSICECSTCIDLPS